MDISNETGSNSNTYEMLWDCKFCGTRKLLGKTHRFCPNCGGQQDPSWRYFPADKEKVEVENHLYVGADLICRACHALNGAKCEYCGNCGAPLSDAVHAREGATREKDEAQAFATEDLKQRQQTEQAAPLASIDQRTNSWSPKLKPILTGVLVAIALTIYAFTRTEVTTVNVTGFKWQRTIGIEMMQAVPGRAECGNQPGDAYNISQHYEQVGTRQVPDGETCQTRQIDQGDGTFREQQECHTRYRSEAVMGYMCSYVVNRWVPIDAALSSGDKTTVPYWPVTNLSSNAGCLMLGCKRETQRNEKYLLLLRSEKNRDYECAVSPKLWDRSTEGESFRIKVGSLLHHAKCATLMER